MAHMAARWRKLVSSTGLSRSSHLLSANAPDIWIFGGELLPRQPVGNDIDLVGMGTESEGISLHHNANIPPY